MHALLATFNLILPITAAIVVLPVGVLTLQVLMAWRRGAAPTFADAAVRPSVAVIMPAHNESAGIVASIGSVLPQLVPGDRLVVIADNCSDDTSAVAATAGAEVIERLDTSQRGKGYALDFGVRHLKANPPQVVIFVDSDCETHAGAIDSLARECARAACPIQALYLMRSPEGAGLKTHMAEFAWVVKNQVRPLGYSRLGLPCQLTGTGMAFPWETIRSAPLATGHLVEDMQLGLHLASAGHPPIFCSLAFVSSAFPSDPEGLASQRTRWEHGHLGMIASQGGRMLCRAITRGQPLLFAMVLDLCVPPLASLVLVLLGVLGASFVLSLLGGSAVALNLAMLAFGLLAFSILAAWVRYGRHIVSLCELLTAPAYVASKVFIYFKLLTGQQVEWIRTKRDAKAK